MTEKLFYQNSHMQEFTACVQSCEEKNGKYQVVLDRTAFFPEGGGQNGDRGWLDEIPVLDTQEKGDVVYHITESPLEVGAEVKGKLDYAERYSKMQQHTGEHILSGLIHRDYGYDNVGFHLGAEEVTMDFNGTLAMDQLRVLEREANQVIYANLPVLTSYPSKEELQNLTYRSKIEIEGQVRIVTIPGYDVCACCAPHVERTGEIGILKVVNAIRYKGGVRISIQCGLRALEDYNRKEENIYRISALLSAKPLETADAVERLKEEAKTCKEQLMAWQIRLMEEKLASLPEGSKDIRLYDTNIDKNVARRFVNAAMEKCTGICGFFIGNDTDGYQYILGSKQEDLRTFSTTLHKTLGGRGGGKPEMIQGSLPTTKEAIESYFQP